MSGGGGAPGFDGRVPWRLEPPRAHSEGAWDKGGSAGSAGAQFDCSRANRAVLPADGARGVGGGGAERGGWQVSVSSTASDRQMSHRRRARREEMAAREEIWDEF